jgi:hypothetical protein
MTIKAVAPSLTLADLRAMMSPVELAALRAQLDRDRVRDKSYLQLPMGREVGRYLAAKRTQMRIAYADPPYPGQSKKHYADHPDYAGEVDHVALAYWLSEYDGWILHTSSTALDQVFDALRNAEIYPQHYRVMAWVKPFAAFKKNVSVAYAWEPVIVSPCRKPVVAGRCVMRDFISEPITMQRGLAGAKPEAVCRWCFEVVGAEPTDELDDLFPGTGAVTRAWRAFQGREPEEPFEQAVLAV